jgi:anti-anti-sigma factor
MPVSEATIRIALSGAYDISSSDSLRYLLAAGERAAGVIVDVSGVTYAGTTLLNALLHLRSRMRANGKEGVIRLAGTSPQLRKILRITHLDRVFDVM